MGKVITPTGQKILALPLQAKEEKVESIILPETANANLSTAEIVAVGSSVADVYKVGDKILYASGAGVGQFYNGKPHIWLDGGDDKVLSNIWGILS